MGFGGAAPDPGHPRRPGALRRMRRRRADACGPSMPTSRPQADHDRGQRRNRLVATRELITAATHHAPVESMHAPGCRTRHRRCHHRAWPGSGHQRTHRVARAVPRLHGPPVRQRVPRPGISVPFAMCVGRDATSPPSLRRPPRSSVMPKQCRSGSNAGSTVGRRSLASWRWISTRSGAARALDVCLVGRSGAAVIGAVILGLEPSQSMGEVFVQHDDKRVAVTRGHNDSVTISNAAKADHRGAPGQLVESIAGSEFPWTFSPSASRRAAQLRIGCQCPLLRYSIPLGSGGSPPCSSGTARRQSDS